jgi:hypothetical protein
MAQVRTEPVKNALAALGCARDEPVANFWEAVVKRKPTAAPDMPAVCELAFDSLQGLLQPDVSPADVEAGVCTLFRWRAGLGHGAGGRSLSWRSHLPESLLRRAPSPSVPSLTHSHRVLGPVQR